MSYAFLRNLICIFEQQDVNGAVLKDLTLQELKQEFGLTFGKAKMLLKLIQNAV